MQAVHSLGNCDIVLITRSLGKNSLLVRIWLRRTARQTNYPVRLLPFPGTLVSVYGSKQPSGRGACETTVSLATYNNQIHRKITQNTLKKLITRLQLNTHCWVKMALRDGSRFPTSGDCLAPPIYAATDVPRMHRFSLCWRQLRLSSLLAPADSTPTSSG